jgi:hypothetical protein
VHTAIDRLQPQRRLLEKGEATVIVTGRPDAILHTMPRSSRGP